MTNSANGDAAIHKLLNILGGLDSTRLAAVQRWAVLGRVSGDGRSAAR
jgi:hypothetical protein